MLRQIIQNICGDYSISNKSSTSNSIGLLNLNNDKNQIDNWTLITAEKLKPILEELQNLLIPESKDEEKHNTSNQNQNEIDMRNVFGFLNYKEWINSISISNVMQICPITIKDMQIKHNIDSELTRESIIECFSYLVASYFCVATEKRMIFLEGQEETKFDQYIKKKLDKER